jgi:cell division initiation protein
MEMSPQRVRSAEFKTVRKGADPDEVRVFLNDVADELERAQNQSAAMEARARAAVARLQEVSDAGAAAAPASVDASVEEAETISRTLLLAQRTADTTVAEARGEAARIVRAANDEAATTLDSTREMAAQLLDEARVEARRVGEMERLALASDVDALKARRDFLESDVQQLELFLTDQRNRLREAATSIVDIAERVPGGLGATRAPLLSASDDEPDGAGPDAFDGDIGVTRESSASESSDRPEDDLVIVSDMTEIESVSDGESAADDPWGDVARDPAAAMPEGEADRDDQNDDFRFSFDDDRT